jgi:hypothetical protein
MSPPLWCIQFCLRVLRAGLIQLGSGHLLWLLPSSPGVGVARLTSALSGPGPTVPVRLHPKPQAGRGTLQGRVRLGFVLGLSLTSCQPRLPSSAVICPPCPPCPLVVVGFRGGSCGIAGLSGGAWSSSSTCRSMSCPWYPLGCEPNAPAHREPPRCVLSASFQTATGRRCNGIKLAHPSTSLRYAQGERGRKTRDLFPFVLSVAAQRRSRSMGILP